MSKGGKEVLIKVVAHSLPSYTMSVFKLSVGICEDINRHALSQVLVGEIQMERAYIGKNETTFMSQRTRDGWVFMSFRSLIKLFLPRLDGGWCKMRAL